MATYYVNKKPQPTGEHEVHQDTCDYLPDYHNRQFLGYFDNCQAAVKVATGFYNNVDGCAFCCPDCHKR